ncbi:phytoene desaturase [soil metagenome]
MVRRRHQLALLSLPLCERAHLTMGYIVTSGPVVGLMAGFVPIKDFRFVNISVIGSGFGGLGAAIRLAARGHRVNVFEARDQPGGRAYTYRQDGFMFDGGPTVITAPWMIEDLFTLAGRNLRDYVELVPLDPFYRIYFDDGSAFEYAASTDQMLANIAAFSCDDDADGYLRMLQKTARIFEKGFLELGDQPFLRFGDMARISPELLKLGSHQSVYQLVKRHISDDKLRQALSFHPLLVGGNPFTTTSIYALIHHLEREWGVWFAKGGTAALIDALVQLFQELGGTLHLGAQVDKIVTRNGRATCVRLGDGREYRADVVVSNADISNTLEHMLEPNALKATTRMRLRTLQDSMSLMVIYFGTDRLYRGEDGPPLAHHTIMLGPRYEALLDDVFKHKVLAEDFSLYLHMPTLTDSSLAPTGCETFYALSPVPNLNGAVDWERAARPYRDRIMSFLEERYLPNLGRHIVTERVIDPRHFAEELQSRAGAAFSFEPKLTQSAWFRPHNRSSDVRNLYFVGAGTHPGAGVPGVLTSARIADALIASDVMS